LGQCVFTVDDLGVQVFIDFPSFAVRLRTTIYAFVSSYS
jgi:hypothetical protein